MALSWSDLTLYLVVYAFWGWLAEAVCCAVVKRRFYNRGLLSLPLILSYGVTFDLLLILLPTLDSRFFQLLATVVIAAVVESLSALLTRLTTPKVTWGAQESRLFTGGRKALAISALTGMGCYLTYLVVQPLLLAGCR